MQQNVPHNVLQENKKPANVLTNVGFAILSEVESGYELVTLSGFKPETF
jgi:hypothetical protein